MQSYTSSPRDPQARLFFNPTFNAADLPAMSACSSVVSRSHVPRPGHAVAASVRMPLSARIESPSRGDAAFSAAATADVRYGALTSRDGLARSGSLLHEERRAKLDKLRAAVEALEADAASGRLTARAR